MHRCDFLSLTLDPPLTVDPDEADTFLRQPTSPITRLPAEIFHVVVFSLLLEYLPAPSARWLCCQKAQQLLALNGLLLIITPDSKHQNKNVGMMKSWRTALESMGFKRWRYVKLQHLHCMAYRKVERTCAGELPPRDELASLMYIPQDSNLQRSNVPVSSAYIYTDLKDETSAPPMRNK